MVSTSLLNCLADKDNSSSNSLPVFLHDTQCKYTAVITEITLLHVSLHVYLENHCVSQLASKNALEVTTVLVDYYMADYQQWILCCVRAQQEYGR